MTLTLPEKGIDHIFIPIEFVRWDTFSNKVEVNLYDNWSYSFKTENGYQSIRGAELKQALSHIQPAPTVIMQRRIHAANRRAAKSNLQYLTEVL